MTTVSTALTPLCVDSVKYEDLVCVCHDYSQYSANSLVCWFSEIWRLCVCLSWLQCVCLLSTVRTVCIFVAMTHQWSLCCTCTQSPLCQWTWRSWRRAAGLRPSPWDPALGMPTYSSRSASHACLLVSGFPAVVRVISVDFLYFVSPSLISFMVSVDVKHHVYLLYFF